MVGWVSRSLSSSLDAVFIFQGMLILCTSFFLLSSCRNKCLLHVLELSRAHIESVALDAALEAVHSCVDPDCRKALKAMVDLFALERIYNDIAFRNDDYIAPEKSKAVRRTVEKLCAELRGVALPLVDAFAIPDHILRAPIALSSAGRVDPYTEYLHAVGFD